MGTCKTCRYWKTHYGVVTTWKECDKVGQENDFDIEVGVYDDSGLTVRLITGPDFGCIKHQPKITKYKITYRYEDNQDEEHEVIVEAASRHDIIEDFDVPGAYIDTIEEVN